MSERTIMREKSLTRKTKRTAHNVIALMFLFIPMVMLGQALFSYGVAGVSTMNESIGNRKIAAAKVQSQSGSLFEEGIISITFDDGWKSVATSAAPIMSEYRIASTQYVIGDSIGKTDYMTVGQIKALKAAGHQVASHSMTHLALGEESEETIRNEMTGSKERLVKLGLVGKDDDVDFAYPYGSRSAVTNAIGADMYRSLRGASSGLNDGTDPEDINTKETFYKNYNFIGMTIDKKTKLSDIREAVVYTKANKGWLVVNFHQIDNENTAYSVSPEKFRSILKIIMDENIKTMTVEDVLVNAKELR